ncbi:hypothetical protein GXW82_02410 [Streptacidiphilus sp. 4-A2]|nr:hypothetical protein [Streptacidiphilus sp. 4-A2]
MSRFVFQQPFLASGLSLDRAGAWADDRVFYTVELVLLAAALLLVRAVHRSRTGRRWARCATTSPPPTPAA